jgi:hypothetical protein
MMRVEVEIDMVVSYCPRFSAFIEDMKFVKMFKMHKRSNRRKTCINIIYQHNGMRFLKHNTSEDIHMSKLLIIIPTPHKHVVDKLPLVTNITE